jgi:tetratricopeptide (TPR) repeat protein
VQVLEKHPQCIKALFRKSQAHTNLGDYIEAQQELDKAIALDSSNSDLLRANKRLKQLRKEADKKDARLFGAMFSKVGTFYQEPKKAADAPVVKPPVDTDEPMYEGEAV